MLAVLRTRRGGVKGLPMDLAAANSPLPFDAVEMDDLAPIGLAAAQRDPNCEGGIAMPQSEE